MLQGCNIGARLPKIMQDLANNKNQKKEEQEHITSTFSGIGRSALAGELFPGNENEKTNDQRN